MATLVKRDEYFVVFDMPENFRSLMSVLVQQTQLEQAEWKPCEIAVLSILRDILRAIDFIHDLKFVHGRLTLKSIFLNDLFEARVLIK